MASVTMHIFLAIIFMNILKFTKVEVKERLPFALKNRLFRGEFKWSVSFRYNFFREKGNNSEGITFFPI